MDQPWSFTSCMMERRVTPAKILSVKGGVKKVSPTNNIKFIVPLSSMYLCSLWSVQITWLYPCSMAFEVG